MAIPFFAAGVGTSRTPHRFPPGEKVCPKCGGSGATRWLLLRCKRCKGRGTVA